MSSVVADTLGPPPCATDEDCKQPGQPCLRATCQPDGSCLTAPADGRPCDDGEPCTDVDRCADGACVGTGSLCDCKLDADCEAALVARFGGFDRCLGAPTCFVDPATSRRRCEVDIAKATTCPPTDTICSHQVCDPKTGGCTEVLAPKDTPCDDGDPCTKGDHCVSGEFGASCEGSAIGDCACTSDADCKGQGNPCTGTFYCDKSGPKGVCTLNTASVVTCPSSKNTACLKNVCDPDKGACALTHRSQLQAVLGADGKATWALLPPGEATVVVGCTDDDPCTQQEVCKGGQCTGTVDTCKCKTNADCAALEDGNACTGTLYCDVSSGQCKTNPATLPACPGVGDTACVKQACVPQSGTCQARPIEQLIPCPAGALCSWQVAAVPTTKAVVCDDGDGCTTGDVCAKGVCVAGKFACDCKTDADCAAKSQKNLCLGPLFCDKAVSVCKANPKDAVLCPSAGDSPCVKNACVPATGDCAMTNAEQAELRCPGGAKAGANAIGCGWVQLPAGTTDTWVPCDDGDDCTANDRCLGGACVYGGQSPCQCKSDADCLAFEDGDLCNGTLFCDKAAGGTCRLSPTTRVVCPSVGDTACLKNACAPANGLCTAVGVEATKAVCWAEGKDAAGNATKSQCTRVQLDAPLTGVWPCDDKQPCTKGDACSQGSCLPGTLVCGCLSDADCAKQEDGDKCNGTLYCDKAAKGGAACKVNPATVVTCADKGDPCTKPVCDPQTGGCVQQAENPGGACDDGDVCTVKDVCSGKACVGAKKSCEDNNPCTLDGCTQASGCTHKATGCDDGNSCTKDLCDPKTGKCSFTAAEGALCNADGSGCTINDSCQAGVCVAGTLASCAQPKDPCLQGVCVSKGPTSFACATAAKPDDTPCPDGDACLIGARCKAGQCQAGTTPRVFARVVAASGQQAGLQVGLRAVALAGEATLVVAGAWSNGLSGPQAQRDWWVAGFGPTGAALWQHKLQKSLFAADVGAAAAVRLGTGQVAVVGTSVAQGTGRDVAVYRVDGTGQGQGQGQGAWAVVALKGEQRAAAARVLSDGVSLLVAGHSGASGGESGLLLRLGGGGALQWQQTYAGGRLSALAVGTSGLALAGQTAKQRGWLVGTDGQGKALWQRDWAPKTQSAAAAKTSALAAVEALADGWALAGEASDDQGTHPWLARADGKGQLLWSRVSSGDQRVSAMRVVGGRWLLTGATTGGNGRLWMAGTDGRGNSQWSTLWDGPGVDQGSALIGLPGGHIAVAGSSGTQGALLRTTAWGQRTCKSAGGCLDKGAGSCDDGKVCTADLCDPAKGCVQAPAVGLQCDPVDGCSASASCVLGACVPSSEGRLWWKNLAAPIGRNGLAVKANGEVVTLATGERRVSTAPGTWSFARGVHLPNGGWKELAPATPGGKPRTNPWDGVSLKSQQSTPTTKPQSLSNALALIPRGDGVLMTTVITSGWTGLTRWDADDLNVLSSTGAAMISGTKVWAPSASLTTLSDGGVASSVQAGYGIRVKKLTLSSGGATLTWQTDSGVGGGVHELAAAPGGGVLLASSVGAPKYAKFNEYMGPRPLTHELLASANGRILWRRWNREAGDLWVGGVSRWRDGWVTVATLETTAGAQQPWAQGTDALGRELWRRVGKPGLSATYKAVVVHQGRILVAGGRVAGGTGLQPWVGELAGGGTELWGRVLDPAVLGEAASLAAGPAGDLYIAGHRLVSGKKLGFLGRVSAFGHTSCGQAGACGAHTLGACQDQAPCTAATCAAAKGCQSAKKACDDGDPCTKDSCDPQLGCVHGPACEDGNLCTIGTCDKAKGCSYAPRSCSDGLACLDDSCDPKTGCAAKPIAAGKACAAGVCFAGTCDTKGACVPATGSSDTTGCLPSKPATSCAAILAKRPGAKSGLYHLDPDGAGPAPPFTGYCEMVAKGGGWLLTGAYHYTPGAPPSPLEGVLPTSPTTGNSHILAEDLGYTLSQVKDVHLESWGRKKGGEQTTYAMVRSDGLRAAAHGGVGGTFPGTGVNVTLNCYGRTFPLFCNWKLHYSSPTWKIAPNSSIWTCSGCSSVYPSWFRVWVRSPVN